MRSTRLTRNFGSSAVAYSLLCALALGCGDDSSDDMTTMPDSGNTLTDSGSAADDTPAPEPTTSEMVDSGSSGDDTTVGPSQSEDSGMSLPDASTPSGDSGAGDASTSSDAATDSGMPDASAGDAAVTTLCEKYGGPDALPAIVGSIFGAISADCRVNGFFAPLPNDKLSHIGDCMVNQVGWLFGCPGMVYDGSVDSQGEVCRSMKDAHMGMGLSHGDFVALLDDMAKGLTAAGIEESDITAAAPALLGMEPDIVESDSDAITGGQCAMGDAGMSDAGMTDAGMLDASTDGG